MSKKILLVEDEALIAMSQAKILEKHGYEVVTVYNGKKAIESVVSDPEINLILMDIDLGKGMSGTEAAEKILEQHDLPIAFLSSHTEPKVVEKTEGITSYGYIVKNSGETVLLASIKMAFKLFEANKKIAQSEAKHRTLFETMSTCVVYHDANGSIISANPASEKLLGLSFDQMKGKTSMDSRWKMINEDGKNVPGSEHPAMIALRTGKKVGPITRGVFVPEKETYVWIIINATPLFKPGEKKPFQVYATFEDITERKMVEKAYQESKEKYKAAFMTSPDSVNINRIDGLYVDINEGFTALTGYTREDVIGKLSSEIDIWSIPEDREKLVKGLKENGEVKNLESVFRCKDGSLKTALMSARFVHINDEPHILSVTRDITRRKKLKEEANKAKRLLETISDIAYETDTEGNITYVNSFTEKITGLSREELIGTPFIPLFVEGDRNSLIEVYRKSLEGQSLENTLTFTTGVICHFTILPRYDENENIIGTFGVGRDITERKKAEKRLYDSEQKYKSLFHQSPVSITIHDKDTGEVIDANQVAFKAYGLNSISEFQKNNFWMEPPYSFNEGLERIHKAATEGLQQFEWKNRDSSGEVFWEYVTLRLVTINEKERVLATAINITEQKNAETDLQKKTEMLNNVIENISDLVVLADVHGYITFHSNLFDIFGYGRDSLIGRNVLEFVHPEDLPEMESNLKKFINNREDKRRVEYRFRCADDSYIWMETDGKTIKDEEGNIKKLLLSARDVTDRKHIEEELQKSKERYRTIFYNSEVSLWEETFSNVRGEINELKQNGITDFNGYFDSHPETVWDLASKIKVIDINEATLRLYGASSKKEMLGSLDKTLYLTDDTYNILKDELVAIAEGRLRVQGEMKTKTLNGTVLNIMMNVYISNEKDIMIVAISDITPYKKALAAKDYLMQELNHRVKNNLAMVSSLISLKESEFKNDLSDLKHRIEVIKLVHEKLHHQNDVEQIEVKEYFQALLESVFYSTFEQPVDIINNIEEINISSKVAIPLGLVVNEIATNAIKYGFSSAQKSSFTIEMARDSENKQYVITLSNTGNPFPEDIELENPETMGLQLVSNLVTQLDGTIELQKKPNTIFTIRFPIGEE